MRKQLFRSISSLTAIVLIALQLLFLAIIIVVLNTLMMRNLDAMEQKNVETHMQQVGVAINSELKDLKKTATDWAERNDAYQFAEDGNQKFVDTNLSASLLRNLRLDAMVYINKSGDFLFAKQTRGDSETLVPVPDATKELIGRLAGTDANTNLRLQEVLKVPDGVILLAVNPVLTSAGYGPAHGTLVIYRYLRGDEVWSLSQLLNQNISIENVSAGDAKQGPSSGPITVTAVSDKTIKGTITMYDRDGNPVVRISANMNRDISAIGQSTIETVVVNLVVSGAASILLILLFLNRRLISRLLSMSKAVKTIGIQEDPSGRLQKDRYCDELSLMTDEINGMLGKLQKSRSDLECREKDLSLVAADLQQEIVERKKAQEEIVYLAYHDHLTSLPNRLHFSEHLKHGILLAKRAEKLLAILFLDLDGFKMINDSMGHVSGDVLLAAVSKRLTSTMRESDTVARMGGDEFIVMVENITDTGTVEAIAKRTVDIFREPFLVNEQECFISASVGIAVYPQDGEDDNTLIKNADIAMYRAKENGKNQYIMCSAGIKNKVMETMRLSNQLFRALEHNEFEVYYQPQVNCGNSRIVGAEALIRWHSPEFGMVLPGMFIPIAEQTGLILSIGEWVLRTACTQAKKWQDAGYPSVRMGVNLSIRQFQNHNIVGDVRSVLTDTGLDPASLELEITESIAMHEKEYVLEALTDLREIGVHVSIDDFGTEYSSMSHLKQLPVDRIKIPMPFVQGIDSSPKDKAITRSIIVLAKSLGLSVTAEGVETKTQYEFLTQKLCDEIQGYYCSRPMPAAEFEALLAEQMRSEQIRAIEQ